MWVHSSVQSGPEKNCTNFNSHFFATVCSRITRFSLTCSGKIIVYKSMQNLVKYSLINSQNWIHVMNKITLHVNITPLTVEDSLLTKTLQTAKVIVEFPQRQCWRKYDVWSVTSNSLPVSLKGKSGSNRRRSEWTASNIKWVNNLNCNQDGQPGH